MTETGIIERIVRLEERAETEGQRCPYREDISRASNNLKRLSDIETTLTSLRIDVAKIAVLGGLSGGGGLGIVGAVIFAVGKAASWW